MRLVTIVLALAVLVVAGAQAARAEEGSFVFSKAPIDPADPQDLATSFAAGDSIYGLIRVPRPWSALGKVEDGKLILAVYTTVDAKRLAAYMELRSEQQRNASHLLFDVAPALDAMTAYRDEAVFYGDAPGGIKKGACQITEVLGQLAPGKHVLTFWVLIAGNKLALGELTIEGQDFGVYRTLHEEIKKELSAGRPFPPAKMTDPSMEEKMRGLLADAGWSEVLKLHIVDKDWWLDRVAGGDTMVKSRHVAAAAAYRDADGKTYYRICTFHEHRLLSGGFGPLELTHQGQPVPISAEALGITAQPDTGPDMGDVPADAMPDFGDPDAVLADVERMRKEAMKKRVFALVGRCGTAANQIKRAVEEDPQGYQPKVKRLWLDVYEEFRKIP
jgi:hypothetical protein